MGFIRAGIACFGGLAMVACGPSSPEPSSPFKAKAIYVRPAAKPDVVECLDPNAETPAWISNGVFGSRVGRDGSGSGPADSAYPEIELFRYSKTGEEKILTSRCPLPLNVRVDGQPVLGKNSTGYRQWIDLEGLPDEVSTEWVSNGVSYAIKTRRPDSGCSYSARIRNAKGKTITFEIDTPNLSLANGLLSEPGEGVRRYVLMIGFVGFSTDHSKNRSILTARIPRDDLEFELVSVFKKKDGSIRHLKPNDPQVVDIEIEGPVEDQQAIRSFLIYVRGSVPINAETPVSPLNTSGTTYNGHVFWDADIWVFPALALLDPERAKTISNYRIAKAKAAEQNFKERRSWVRNAPTAEAVAKIDALQYPWESSVSGLEVSPTETKQQHHITGDVVWGLDLAASLGLADRLKVEAIGRKAAKFYQFRASPIDHETPNGPKDETKKSRSILDTVSPDEHHFGDHDLYTNAIAEWTVRRFDSADKGLPFFLPRDGAGFLNYGGDRMKGYKQAAGALAIYPLQNPAVEKEAKLFMDRFGDKVSKNGPAMTDSVHALIWARLGEKHKAYETWRKSWMDFTNHPLMLFSEKRNKDVTYFSTGAAGCLQTVLYGFLGIRIDTKAQAGAKWSVPLKGGKVLSIKPNLPDEWKSVKVKGLSILGKRYEVVVRGDEVTVTEMK